MADPSLPGIRVSQQTVHDQASGMANGSLPPGASSDGATDGGSPSEVPSLPGWSALGPVPTHSKADEWRFVLRAVNIASWSSIAPDGTIYLMVPSAMRARAARELDEYEVEQHERRTRPTTRDVPLHPYSWWGVAAVALMMAFFLVTGPLQDRSVWFQHGIADTNQILAGAVEQTVTALTLHTDAAHVLGNAMVGGLFLTAVHRRYGAGLGTFVVIGAGAVGNLLNAMSYGHDHRSLGASTAVMAALGVLASAQFVRNQRERPGFKTMLAWAPVAGGLALLGTFGAAPHSDLRAHGFGFLAGFLLGFLPALAFRRRTTPLPAWARIAFGLATIALICGSWAVAFLVPPA